MQLRVKHGWGYRRISQALSSAHGVRVPKGTVQNWILGIHNPSRRLHRYFEPIPSPELSYIIGIVLGDGYTTEDQGRGIVGLTNKDRSLLTHFLSCISKVLNCPSAGRITSGTPYGTLKATIASRLLALFLQTPLPQLAAFVEQNPAPFVRGFFDAEGCAMITTGGGRLRVGVNVSNTDIQLLEYVSTLLRDRFGIDSHITVGGRPCLAVLHGRPVNFKKTVFVLRIHKLSHVLTFAKDVGFSCERKQSVLRDALAILLKHGSRNGVGCWIKDYEKQGFRWTKRSG